MWICDSIIDKIKLIMCFLTGCYLCCCFCCCCNCCCGKFKPKPADETGDYHNFQVSILLLHHSRVFSAYFSTAHSDVTCIFSLLTYLWSVECSARVFILICLLCGVLSFLSFLSLVFHTALSHMLLHLGRAGTSSCRPSGTHCYPTRRDQAKGKFPKRTG